MALFHGALRKCARALADKLAQLANAREPPFWLHYSTFSRRSWPGSMRLRMLRMCPGSSSCKQPSQLGAG